MIATVLVLMAALVGEVFVWSVAYSIADAAPEGSDPFYFAFVNYTARRERQGKQVVVLRRKN